LFSQTNKTLNLLTSLGRDTDITTPTSMSKECRFILTAI